MDVSFCGLNVKTAKLTKNVTSNEMMDTKHDQKNVDKMRPSAATLVQRYTRNGNSMKKKLGDSMDLASIKNFQF